MHPAGRFVFGTVQWLGGAIFGCGLLWDVMFLFVEITEEDLLRGYPQRVSTDGLRHLGGDLAFWISAGVFSFLFACLHLANPAENKLGIVMVLTADWSCASVFGVRETCGFRSAITPPGDRHFCLARRTGAFRVRTRF
jgi:membrane protease YdiL (CAAX protease family)